MEKTVSKAFSDSVIWFSIKMNNLHRAWKWKQLLELFWRRLRRLFWRSRRQAISAFRWHCDVGDDTNERIHAASGGPPNGRFDHWLYVQQIFLLHRKVSSLSVLMFVHFIYSQNRKIYYFKTAFDFWTERLKGFLILNTETASSSILVLGECLTNHRQGPIMVCYLFSKGQKVPNFLQVIVFLSEKFYS